MTDKTNISSDFSLFGGNVEFVQIAITPEEARDRDLPSAPPRATDRRGAHFTDSETWQAEALDPNDLSCAMQSRTGSPTAPTPRSPRRRSLPGCVLLIAPALVDGRKI